MRQILRDLRTALSLLREIARCDMQILRLQASPDHEDHEHDLLGASVGGATFKATMINELRERRDAARAKLRALGE